MINKKSSLLKIEQSVYNLAIAEKDQFKQQSEHNWLKLVCLEVLDSQMCRSHPEITVEQHR